MNMILCECESKCGTLIPEFDSQGRKRRFVNGHSSRGINHVGKNNPMFGKKHSPKTKQLISENRKGIFPSPKAKQLMSEKHKGIISWNKGLTKETNKSLAKRAENIKGENNPNWQGGIARLPYCPIWTKWFRKEIKERDNFRCQNPDCEHKFEKLVVHHIDYDKKNCSTNNLITLCRSCNAKANFNREHWKEFYSNKIINIKMR